MLMAKNIFAFFIILCIGLYSCSFIEELINIGDLLDESKVRSIGEYFTKFAAFSYCNDTLVNTDHKCCYIKQEGEEDIHSTDYLPSEEGKTLGEWTLIKHGKSNSGSTMYKDEENIYSVFLSKSYKKIVFSFTGTQTFASQLVLEEFIKNTRQQMDCEVESTSNEDDEDNVCIGTYFKVRITDLLDPIFSLKQKMAQELKTYQVIVTGHSLGGASADVFLYYAVKGGFIDRYNNMPVIVTYGQPKSGNQKFAFEIERMTEAKFRFVNEDDPVPTVPFVSYSVTYNGKNRVKKSIDYSDSIYIFYIDYKNKITYKDGRDTPYSEDCQKIVDQSKFYYKIIPNKIMPGANEAEGNQRRLIEEENLKLNDDLSESDGYIEDIVALIIKLLRTSFIIYKKYISHVNYFSKSIGSYCEKVGNNGNFIKINFLLLSLSILLNLF